MERKRERLTRLQFERHIAGRWSDRRSPSGTAYRVNGHFKTWVTPGWKHIHDGTSGLRAKTWLELARFLGLVQSNNPLEQAEHA